MIRRALILVLLWPALALGAGLSSWNGKDIATVKLHGGTLSSWHGADLDTYSDILFWWTCESANLGASDYSAGDTSASLASGAAINTDANKSGTNGMDLPTAGDYAQFAVSGTDLINRAEGSLAIIFRLNTAPGNGVKLMNANASGGANSLSVEFRDTDEVRLSFWDGTNTHNLTTSGANVTTGTWYMVVVRWHDANEDRFVGVYNASTGATVGTAEDLSTAFSAGGSNYVLVNWGDNGSGTQDTHMDQIAGISSSYSRDWLALRSLTESPR